MALTQGNKVEATDFNALFTTLERIRKEHLNAKGQTSAANSALSTPFKTDVAVTGQTAVPSNVQALKDNLTTLVNSTWLESSFASSITVPPTGSLLKAVDLTNIKSVIDSVDAICPNYSQYSQYGQYGAYADYSYEYGDCWW